MLAYKVAYLKNPASRRAIVHEVFADSITEAAYIVANRYDTPLNSIVRISLVLEEKIRERKERERKLEEFLKKMSTGA